MQKIFTHGKIGIIETIIEEPKENLYPDISAVLCHPHPLFKGTMHNKVITTLAKAFNNLGIKSVRFNYRGVGKSEGMYDNGKGEVEDTLCVIRSLLENNANQKIILAGFSFGGSVAYKAATNFGSLNIISLLTVAPAIKNFPLNKCPEPSMSWCLIQGVDDNIVSYKEVSNFFMKQTSVDATFIRINGVGHFFHGQLIKLKKYVENYYQVEIISASKK